MKLRIKGNSLRLRLSKTEVQKLVEEGEVFESAHIMNETFVYGAKLGGNEGIEASLVQNRIIVSLQRDMVTNWDKNEEVGFEATTDQGLLIVVEKDFQCLNHREGEDESDLHINPQGKK